MSRGHSGFGNEREPVFSYTVRVRAFVLTFILAIAPWAVAQDVPGFLRNLNESDVASLKAQAERGDADAQFEIALVYAYGAAVPRNDLSSAQWMRKAAESGHPRAMANLGLMYQEGRGVPQDHKLALTWMEKSAELHDSDGEFFLAHTYDQGIGVT